MLELKADTFFIPHEDNFIAYFPLRNVAFLLDEEGKQELLELIDGVVKNKSYNDVLLKYYNVLINKKITPPFLEELKINEISYISFILTNKCNLNCSYCYAKDERNNSSMTKGEIADLIEAIFKIPRKHYVVTFIGGGEPTFEWDLFEFAVSEFKRKAVLDEKEIVLKIATNGINLDEEKIKWLIKNNILVSLSFDILPEIQNKQRSHFNPTKNSFDIVNENLKIFKREGKMVGIRSTITFENVSRMSEMVQFVKDNYPFVKSMTFEPERSPNIHYGSLLKQFVPEFIKAMNLAKKLSMSLRCSYKKSFNKISARFCLGELCFSPNGTISSCHRVTDENNLLAEEFLIGDYLNGSLNIDIDKFNSINKKSANDKQTCQNCFLKWHCAGGCCIEDLTTPIEQKEEICIQLRNLYKEFILEKLN